MQPERERFVDTTGLYRLVAVAQDDQSIIPAVVHLCFHRHPPIGVYVMYYKEVDRKLHTSQEDIKSCLVLVGMPLFLLIRRTSLLSTFLETVSRWASRMFYVTSHPFKNIPDIM